MTLHAELNPPHTPAQYANNKFKKCLTRINSRVCLRTLSVMMIILLLVSLKLVGAEAAEAAEAVLLHICTETLQTQSPLPSAVIKTV